MKQCINRPVIIFFISCLLFVLSQFYRASVAEISPIYIEELNLDSFLQGFKFLMDYFYPNASLSPDAFRLSFFFCAGCLAVSALLYLMTRETLRRKK